MRTGAPMSSETSDGLCAPSGPLAASAPPIEPFAAGKFLRITLSATQVGSSGVNLDGAGATDRVFSERHSGYRSPG